MKKRIFSLLIILSILLTMAVVPTHAAIIESGTCGDNLTWTLDDNGTLTISGTGDMTDYSTSSSVPWYSNRLSIKKIVINNSVTSIGDYAFDGCSSLTGITIPDSVTSIGDYAFYKCSGLTSITIPNSVTSIGIYAFYGCSSLTGIAIPDSVTIIGKCAFVGCSSLTSINVSENNQNYSSQDGVLFNKAKTELICCPSRKKGLYTIPNSVTSIGIDAFSGCSSLTSITIPDSVTSIGTSAFSNCSSLTSITIPNSVTSIGGYAFYYCSRLTSITIPAGITSIGSGMFGYCSCLQSVTIPNSVTSIGIYAFSDCSRLEKVYYFGTKSQWDNISIGLENVCLKKAKLYAMTQSGTCGSDVKWKISEDGTLTISGTGDMEDYSSSSLPWANAISFIKTVVISDGVTSIGDYAFRSCSNLTSITIGADIISIGSNAFSSSSITSINVSENNQNYSSQKGILLSKDKTTLVCCPRGIKGAYTIPYGIITVGESAFYNCGSLTSITIPDSVTSIGNKAFYCCSSLTSITIPPSVGVIKESAFQGCSNLTSITIPPSVGVIKESAFQGCSNLTSITIPPSIAVIRKWAFDNCNKLKKVYYSGTASKWEHIIIESGNSNLEFATRYYLYTITYTGEYEGTDKEYYLNTVTFPTLPEPPYGYKYIFTVNDTEWDGVVQGDTTVVVTKVPASYTVTYTEGYEGTDHADYLTAVTFPTIYGYTCTFKVNGEVWDGIVKGDTTVVVTKTPINYTVTYTGEYEGTGNADYLTTVTLPTAPYGYIYHFTVNGESWDGIVNGDTTVVVTKTPINYTVTYTGDYTGTDNADYLKTVTFPTIYGYTCTFKVNDEIWDGIVKGDTTVVVTKTPINYTVTYTGGYAATENADYLTTVTFPAAPYGYTYTFKVNGEEWDGVVKGDTTVVVTKTPINYTVTYTGGYAATENADYLTTVTFPAAPYGYTYTFKVNDERWDGVVKGDTTVVVTKTPINYTVTYTGDYEGTDSVDYLTSVTLPTPPENYIYRFTVNGSAWDGVVKGDTTVVVSKLCDLTELDIANIEDVQKDEDSIYGKFYGKSFVPQVSVSENAAYSIYRDENCTQTLSRVTLSRGENTFYIKVTAESGRIKVYKITVDRDIPESLGTLSFVQAIKDTMIFKLDSKIAGNPEITILFGKTQDVFNDTTLCIKRTATISSDKQSLYISELSPDEQYYFKAIARYDDIETESSVVFAYTALSGECYVISVLSPAGGVINHEEGTISDLRVANRFNEILIDVLVSPKATWDLYYDKKATKICENRTLSLNAGEEKTAYIKVTAEDGTEKIYSISIYRQTKSKKPVISVWGGMATITSEDNKNIFYSFNGTYPTEFSGTAYSGPFEVSEGTVIRAIAKQEGMDEYSDVASYTVDEFGLIAYGDVNGDGEVTAADNVFLARHLAGWKDYGEINTDTADVNCDKKVNAFDNIVLARHLAGWIGYLDLPYEE